MTHSPTPGFNATAELDIALQLLADRYPEDAYNVTLLNLQSVSNGRLAPPLKHENSHSRRPWLQLLPLVLDPLIAVAAVVVGP